jgi:uncharacterized membrane protein required for colicin V production
MWFDGLALLLLGLFTGMGVYRGGLATALGLISLGVAYAAGLVTAARLGPVLARQLDMPEFLGLPLVGMVAFTLAYFVMGVVGSVLRRRSERRRAGRPRSARDRFAGGVFGLARGGLVVVLLAWLAIWVDALRATGAMEGLPSVAGSATAAVTETLVETGVSAALSDAGVAGQFMANMAARPGNTVADLQELVEDPRIEALREDRIFWTYVENGAVDSALNQPSFLRLAGDEDFRQRLAALGLVGSEAAGDRMAFRDSVAETIHEVGPRVQRLRNDPGMQALMQDPEVVAMVQSGDTMALVTQMTSEEN